jgi:uncharacterized iron-regulated membrane protein
MARWKQSRTLAPQRSRGPSAKQHRVNALLVQVHRYAGLVTLLFLAVASATGIPLVFSHELDALLTPELHRGPDRGPPPPPSAVIARLQRDHPEFQVTAFPLAGAAGRTIEVKVAAWPGARPLGFDQAFVDPYTGAVVGVRTERPGFDRAHLMRGVYLLHFTLLGGDAGRWFMGVVAIAWTLNNIIGFYLTLPSRRPFWKRWKPLWTVSLHARWPRVLLDLHRASGLWLFIGVLLLALTSVALNFYSEAFQPLVAGLSPPKASPWDRRAAPPDPAYRPRLSFAQAEGLAIAAARRDGLALKPAVDTYDAERRLFGVRFSGDGRETYAGLGPVTYYVDDRSGRLAFIDNPLTDSAGQKVLRGLYPLHSGQVAGLATRLFVGLLGLSVLEMSITVLIVWWKRRGPRVAARMARGRPELSRVAGE